MKIFNMNKSMVAVRCLVSTMLLAFSIELCEAFIASSSPPPPTTTAARIGIIPEHHNNLLFPTTNSYLMVEYSGHNSNNNIIGEGLFRSFRSNYNRGQQEQQQHMDPEYATRTTTLLPLQVVKIVSQMIGELLSNKKRYISIIAAAIIAFGSFPSHVMAEQQTDNTVTVTSSSSSTIHNMRVTPTITLISQTPTMIESDHKKDFLQYNDDEGDGDNFFATGGSYVEEESTTSTSTDSSMLTTETTEDEQEAQHIKYDSKNDHMSKVIGAVGGVIAGSTVTRMALFLLKKDRTSREIMNQQDDDVDENDNDNDDDNDNDNSNKKTEIIRINSNTDRSSNILPLCDPKYVQARKQPKSQKDEALLAARYGAISDLEEKAYQILVDLGMIEVHHSL